MNFDTALLILYVHMYYFVIEKPTTTHFHIVVGLW
jgi:hypothetical protein